MVTVALEATSEEASKFLQERSLLHAVVTSETPAVEAGGTGVTVGSPDTERSFRITILFRSSQRNSIDAVEDESVLI